LFSVNSQEASIPTTRHDEEVKRGLEIGLPGASSIEDKTIPTFSRGELPHFAGINTFMKAPYVENIHDVGNFDATVIGVPFDGGCTYRAGTRFGPQGIRRISALYTPYNYEMGIDLREQMTLCDAGDVFTIPANIEKSFDQISNAVAHVAASGSFPIILGGDHSSKSMVKNFILSFLESSVLTLVHFSTNIISLVSVSK
jgi:agmatinase